MPTITHALLSAAPASPPTEFRLFSKGVNHTTKGDFIFDDAAAASVMAAFRLRGVDLPVDLEHESLGVATRSDSADARGWFKLALRNGELWATAVTWTPDGARRLKERTQRYISPAFTTDDEGRVREVLNVALTAMPATHNAPAIAASKFGRSASTMLGARVSRNTAVVFRILAARKKTTPGALLRSLVATAVGALEAGASPAAAKVFADLADILEQPAGTAPADLIAMLQELATGFDAGTVPTPDPLAAAADPAPTDPFKLTDNQARLMIKMTPDQRRTFLALCRKHAADRQAQTKKANRR